MIGGPSDIVVRHLLRSGHVEDLLPNGRRLRLWSEADDWVSNQVFWRGWRSYEPDTASLFFGLAERATTVVDIGAYVGYYTLLAAHANPDATVMAFEPHPKVFQRLKNHVALNQVSGVRARQLAVGNESGQTRFFTDPERLPTSSGLSERFFRETAHVPISVRVERLDDLLDSEGVGSVGLMKIDTESTEPDVIDGARRSIERDRPFIVCEVLSEAAAAALDDRRKDLGYRSYALSETGPVAEERIRPDPVRLNHLFVPQEKGLD
jgi:FkbM family methyltransferase